MFSYFSKTSSEKKMTDAIINKLIKFRKSDYNPIEINKLSDLELKTIKNTVTMLGIKILNTRFNQNPDDSSKSATHHFLKTIEHLMVRELSKFSFISYVAQLLQYYTITSDQTFLTETPLVDFNEFLKNNLEKFGNTDKNLLITEYKLIKLYNDLCKFKDKQPDDLQKNFLYLRTQLSMIQKQVEQWGMEAPNDVFVKYLLFVIHYSWSKMHELEFTLLENLDTEESLNKAYIQEIHLKEAERALQQLKELMENSSPDIQGLEFSFGQNVLNFLPVKDLDEVASHISRLLHSSHDSTLPNQ